MKINPKDINMENAKILMALGYKFLKIYDFIHANYLFSFYYIYTHNRRKLKLCMNQNILLNWKKRLLN